MMPLFQTIFISALVAAILLLILRLEGVIERLVLVVPTRSIEIIVETRSLRQFKRARDALALLAGIEAALGTGLQLKQLALGGACMVVGVALRLASIATLREMWSFHPLRYAEHRLVDHGIYRYLKHPAYVGNIYLFGLFLGVGAPVAATLALVMISVFYCYRAQVEGRLLADLREHRS